MIKRRASRSASPVAVARFHGPTFAILVVALAIGLLGAFALSHGSGLLGQAMGNSCVLTAGGLGDPVTGLIGPQGNFYPVGTRLIRNVHYFIDNRNRASMTVGGDCRVRVTRQDGQTEFLVLDRGTGITVGDDGHFSAAYVTHDGERAISLMAWTGIRIGDVARIDIEQRGAGIFSAFTGVSFDSYYFDFSPPPPSGFPPGVIEAGQSVSADGFIDGSVVSVRMNSAGSRSRWQGIMDGPYRGLSAEQDGERLTLRAAADAALGAQTIAINGYERAITVLRACNPGLNVDGTIIHADRPYNAPMTEACIRRGVTMDGAVLRGGLAALGNDPGSVLENESFRATRTANGVRFELLPGAHDGDQTAVHIATRDRYVLEASVPATGAPRDTNNNEELPAGCGDGICTDNENRQLCVDPAPGADLSSDRYGCHYICPEDCQTPAADESPITGFLRRAQRQLFDAIDAVNPLSLMLPDARRSCILSGVRSGQSDIHVVAHEGMMRTFVLGPDCGVFLTGQNEYLGDDNGATITDGTFTAIRMPDGAMGLSARDGAEGWAGQLIAGNESFTLRADPPNDPTVGGFCCPEPGKGLACVAAPRETEVVEGRTVLSHTLCKGGAWFPIGEGDVQGEREDRCNALCAPYTGGQEPPSQLTTGPQKAYCNPVMPSDPQNPDMRGLCRMVSADSQGMYPEPQGQDYYIADADDDPATCENWCGYYYCVYQGDVNNFGAACTNNRLAVIDHPGLCVESQHGEYPRLGTYGFVETTDINGQPYPNGARYLQPGFCAQVPDSAWTNIRNDRRDDAERAQYMVSLLWGTLATQGDYEDGSFRTQADCERSCAGMNVLIRNGELSRNRYRAGN